MEQGPDRDRVKAIVSAALEARESERAALVERECAGDAALLREVKSLLQATPPAALDGPTADLRQVIRGELDRDIGLPKQIGPYIIIKKLGEGGMGVVFEAEQATPRRRVALKVMRGGAMSRTGQRRFAREVRLLGRLEHTGIARIYDAGAAEVGGVGVPYYTMELVHGTPITEFAEGRGWAGKRAKLSPRERLELLCRVCDAVQHAHTNSIVHRDLTPRNIVVEDAGQPKVLDFGLAAALAGEEPVQNISVSGEVMGTPAYMSPEQAAGRGSRADARTDVYALGAIAFELLTGRPPHDLSGLDVPQAARKVAEEEPARLGSVSRVFRGGDVETIVGKALSHELDRRYGSVAEFAADLRRFLSDEPVLARAPSTLYQLGKFAKRNRVLVGAVTAVLLALTAGSGVALWKAAEARKQALTANVMSSFVLDVLTPPSDTPFGKRLKLQKEMLDAIATKVDSTLGDFPVLRARWHAALATQYADNGLHPQAVGHATKALELAPLAGFESHEHLVRQWTLLIGGLGENYQGTAAIALIERYRAVIEDPATSPEDRAKGEHAIAEAYIKGGHPESALPLLTALLERELAAGPLDADRAAWASRQLDRKGMALAQLGRLQEAEETLREAIRLGQKFPEDGKSYGNWEDAALNNLAAAVLMPQRRYAEAEELLRRALHLKKTRHQVEEDNLQYLNTWTHLARCLGFLGRAEDAEREWKAIEPNWKDHSEDEIQVHRFRAARAVFLAAQGRLNEARPLLAAALPRLERDQPAHPITVEGREALARMDAGAASERPSLDRSSK